jgi:stage II sporulation SpoAA-like protein
MLGGPGQATAGLVAARVGQSMMGPGMFTVEVRVGRLLEIRLVGLITPEDFEQVSERMDALFAKHGEVVIVADYTHATVFSQEAAAKLLDIFKRAKGRTARSAALVSQSAIFSIQVERLITQAGNPLRRSFHDPFELKAFLGAALTHEEHVRLIQFLAEAPAKVRE